MAFFVLFFGVWPASGLQNTPKKLSFRSVTAFSNSTSVTPFPNSTTSTAAPSLTSTEESSPTGLGSTTSPGSYAYPSSFTTSDSTTTWGNKLSSYTDLPPFTVPTGTITTGPEETSEAVKAAPILWYLWQKKSLLQDEDHKQEYIDDVKKSRDNFVAYSISLKPNPPPCRSARRHP